MLYQPIYISVFLRPPLKIEGLRLKFPGKLSSNNFKFFSSIFMSQMLAV